MARHNAKHERRKKTSEKKPPVKKIGKLARPEEIEKYCRKIKTFLQTSNKKQLKKTELSAKCRSKRNSSAYEQAVEKLLRNGEIIQIRQSYKLSSQEECFKADRLGKFFPWKYICFSR